MTNFQDALDHCQLSDMGFSGPRFTWSNRKTDYMFTKESLDRAVANTQFALRFPQLTVRGGIGCKEFGPCPSICGLTSSFFKSEEN
jgi:hypothetical protein